MGSYEYLVRGSLSVFLSLESAVEDVPLLTSGVAMIVANLATYPPRRENLLPVLRTIAPQVDRLNVVLNQYGSRLPELEQIPKVVQILPGTDTKDVGKFYPEAQGAEYVLLIDDDLVFPPDFVSRTVSAFRSLGEGKFFGGYHGSLYVRPGFSLKPKRFWRWLTYTEGKVAGFRRRVQVHEAVDKPLIVDQIATNAAIIRGSDLPPYEFMADSQKFVDVRIARWNFERGILPVLLPRPADWIGQVRFEDTIYRSFTCKDLPHVAEEIMSYAFKVEGRGSILSSYSDAAEKSGKRNGGVPPVPHIGTRRN